MMVHRFKKFLFRIQKDPVTQEDIYKQYEIKQGFTSQVAIAGQSLFCSSVTKDYRYNKEIDDPNFIGVSGQTPARELIACPIFASDDALQLGRDSLTSLPRAILILINKLPDPVMVQKVINLDEKT